ncbi:MAG TPA: hypothetical protein VGC79_21180 [Polyangiaceae bacterium]
MPPPNSPARMVAQDRDYFVAVWHETVISVFRGAVTLQHVLDISNTCKALLDERRGEVTYLSVVERSSPAPTETVRRALAFWSRDVVTKLGVAVMVAEGGGFKNALVRGVGVALTVLAPHKVPFKFSGSVDEGAALITAFLSEKAGGAEQLILAIAEARERWERTL